MKFDLTEEWVKDFLPQRSQFGHKGDFGFLTIVAGSQEYMGAACLASSSALRSGTGIVRLASLPKICEIVTIQNPSCTFLPLEISPTGSILSSSCHKIFDEKSTAILAGCGLGNSSETANIVTTLLTKGNCPIVLDADALNVMAGYLSSGRDVATRDSLFSAFYEYPYAKIITPHVGEMARLSGYSVAKVEQDMERIATQFAYIHQCIVVLKSHITVIASPDKTICINSKAGNSGLAKGGSGDVLAGIISSLLAQKMHPFAAAACGVWLHATAADYAAADLSEAGLSPADLPHYLCKVWKHLEEE